MPAQGAAFPREGARAGPRPVQQSPQGVEPRRAGWLAGCRRPLAGWRRGTFEIVFLVLMAVGDEDCFLTQRVMEPRNSLPQETEVASGLGAF